MAEYKIQIEDIPEQYSDIVRALGLEKFIALCDLSGGEVIYIPMLKSLANAARNGEIYKRFTGGNIRQLAAQYKLSQRQIRRIIEGQKRLAKDGDSK